MVIHFEGGMMGSTNGVNTGKQDGWLAGVESDALPHDKARAFGDGGPPQRYSPALVSTGASECPSRLPRKLSRASRRVLISPRADRLTIKAPRGPLSNSDSVCYLVLFGGLFPVISEC
jgi:hypothetical protein